MLYAKLPLSFLYQNITNLILFMVCRSIRSHASATPDTAVCKQALMFWLRFPSTVLLGQYGYITESIIETWTGLLSASVSPGTTNCALFLSLSFNYWTFCGCANIFFLAAIKHRHYIALSRLKALSAGTLSEALV